MLVTPFVDHSGPIMEEKSGTLDGGQQENVMIVPLAGPWQSESPHPLPGPQNVSFTCLPCSHRLLQDYSFEIEIGFVTIWMVHWTELS